MMNGIKSPDYNRTEDAKILWNIMNNVLIVNYTNFHMERVTKR